MTCIMCGGTGVRLLVHNEPGSCYFEREEVCPCLSSGKKVSSEMARKAIQAAIDSIDKYLKERKNERI